MMWKLLVIFGLVVIIDCRRIHEPGFGKDSSLKGGNAALKGIKGLETENSFDLDNCTDCEREEDEHPKAIPEQYDLGTKENPTSTKTTDAVENGFEAKHTKKQKKSKYRDPKRKAGTKSNKKEETKQKETRGKLHAGGASDVITSDVIDNSSQDRMRTQRLKQLPGVARLEQRLHPTVKNPIHNMMMSMERILQTMGYSVRKVDVDHQHMFNATRYEIMMNVRKELMHIAEENDKAYDAVLQASLLTKDIYRRAHRQREHGPRTIPAAVSSDSMPKLRRIPMREIYLQAREEQHKAERLKHKIAIAERERYTLQSRLMEVERQVESNIPARTLRDLIRISNQTLRVLQTFSPTIGTGGRIHLYGHMHRNGMENLKEARDLMYDAKNILSETKSKIMFYRKHYLATDIKRNYVSLKKISCNLQQETTLPRTPQEANPSEKWLKPLTEDISLLQLPLEEMGRNLRNLIHRRVRDGTSGTLSDMPFDDSRMMLWAVVDSARHHAQKLARNAANIHMKLTPILKSARKFIDDRDKNALSIQIERRAGELRKQIKTLHTTLDKIRVIIGDEDILKSRCEAIHTSDEWYNDKDNQVINCDDFIIIEGSGTELEGSGDFDTDIDFEIPKTDKDGTMGKSSVNISGTKNDTIVFGKGRLAHSGVTQTTDDEDILIKTNKPETTTKSAPTTTVPLSEDLDEDITEEEDGFEFTDLWGVFSDDPLAGLVNRSLFSTLILKQLAIYSKDSVDVFSSMNKTKTTFEDLKMQWNETKRSYENFENNVFAMKVFLHGWAAKKMYFDAVHDRVMALKEHTDLQSVLIDKQCSEAVTLAERKLEEAEDKQERRSTAVDISPDPEDFKIAAESVTQVTEEVKEILKLKKVYPDPCNTVQNLNSVLRSNISELRKKIEKAKLIASTLQVPVSMNGSSYLNLPLVQDEAKTPRLTLSMNVKPRSQDGPIAAVKTKNSGALVVSVKKNVPALTILDSGEYSIGEVTSDMEFSNNDTYRISVERLGSLFSLFVQNIMNNNVLFNNSILIDSVDLYQNKPSNVYLAGVPEGFPTYGTGIWQGCFSHVSVNGRYLSLLKADSDGKMPDTCSNMSFLKREDSIVLGGTGYARLPVDPVSYLRRGAMDNMALHFKAYTDGILLHIESASTRSFERIQIKGGKIIVAFKNHYGETVLQSKRGTFVYGKEHALQVTVKPGRQLELDLSLNGEVDSFEKKKQSPSVVQVIMETALYIGGLPSSLNSSITGCVQKFILNEQEVTLSTAEVAHDVYYGPCQEGNCITFLDSSLPIDLGESKKRNSLVAVLTYGSTGNILEYSKGENLKLTIKIDSDGLDMYEAIGEVSERIYLEDHSVGDVITVILKASSDEVEVEVDDITKTIPYDGGGGWGNIFADDEDAKYSILVGGTSENDEQFEGSLIDFFMNGRPINTAAYLESNNLLRCSAPTRRRRQEEVTEETEKFTC